MKKMSSRDAKTSALGAIGEKIISNYLNRQGKNVQISVDPFDSKKDMSVDGKKIEVKTQTAFILENAVTIQKSQLNKCRNVDMFFVVIAPAPKHQYRWEGWILQVDPKSFKTRNRITRDGREMILIDIEQDAVVPIEKIPSQEIAVMRKYTSSEY